jgi:saccharopine dehydrogenase-like NADP-dependent oxidoreductase
VRVALVGLGAVGSRVARQLLVDPVVTSLVVVHRDPNRVAALTERLGDGWGLGPAGGPQHPPGSGRRRLELVRGHPTDVPADADVVVLTHPSGVRAAAEASLARGSHVVTTVDDPTEVRRLLALDDRARRAGQTLVVGAAMAPGLSGVLAGFGARRLDVVDQIHVASLGTGGPACARQHHAALSSLAVDWVGGAWHRRPGGSGRELVWFPEPAGGADCYRAGLADPLLLQPAFPGVQRITARLAATRRDRTTSWLPMMRAPHPEGLLGAVRVELRGWRDEVAEVEIHGATARPAVIAATVAALAATWAGEDRLARTGAGGLAGLVTQPAAFLRDLHARGVRTVRFEGSETE